MEDPGSVLILANFIPYNSDAMAFKVKFSEFYVMEDRLEAGSAFSFL